MKIHEFEAELKLIAGDTSGDDKRIMIWDGGEIPTPIDLNYFVRMGEDEDRIRRIDRNNLWINKIYEGMTHSSITIYKCRHRVANIAVPNWVTESSRNNNIIWVARCDTRMPTHFVSGVEGFHLHDYIAYFQERGDDGNDAMEEFEEWRKDKFGVVLSNSCDRIEWGIRANKIVKGFDYTNVEAVSFKETPNETLDFLSWFDPNGEFHKTHGNIFVLISGIGWVLPMFLMRNSDKRRGLLSLVFNDRSILLSSGAQLTFAHEEERPFLLEDAVSAWENTPASMKPDLSFIVSVSYGHTAESKIIEYEVEKLPPFLLSAKEGRRPGVYEMQLFGGEGRVEFADEGGRTINYPPPKSASVFLKTFLPE